MTKTAIFSFFFQSCDDAQVVADALTPEILHRIPKTKVEVQVEEKTLILNISAKELSSLRAACNSYLRWVDTAVKVAQLC
jgi:tRNA threonylcarbamoyladenosine modification (KEOPS) complex  Pcc1 subunit